MKKIGFIGAYDKSDLILYVAKVIAETRRKVLVADATILQRTRYIVPCIAPSKYYIVEFEDFDVAVGFNDLNEIQDYLGSESLQYDIILVDVDDNNAFRDFEMEKANKNFFVTGFDSFSLKKGLDIIGNMHDKFLMKKVLFSHEMLEEENDYLDFLSFYYSIKWEPEYIFFPYEMGDGSALIENQRSSQIRFKNLSDAYKDGLLAVATDIIPDAKNSEIKKIIFKRGD